MDLTRFAAEAKVKIIMGKGGVGKTTVTAALARGFARSGLRVLIVELDDRPELGRAFGHERPLGYEATTLEAHEHGGSVEARRIAPDDALLEYLHEHGLARLGRRLLSTGVLDAVAGSIPGLRDVLVLGKVKQLAGDESIDLLLVDAPATGHAMTLLTSAAGLVDIARSGLVRSQAEEVVALLSDPSRCQVLLVTLPEELPVSETIEAAYLVEDRASVALGPIICNHVERASELLECSATHALEEASLQASQDLIAALDDAARFQRHRAAISEEQLDRLRRELPLSILELPWLPFDAIGPRECDLLAEQLIEEIGTLDEQLL
jgi:anion-transporting  ArsA/GET3 family ATPase